MSDLTGNYFYLSAEPILRQYCFENHGNVAECVRKLRTDFGRRKVLSAPYVRYLVKKVKETGIFIHKSKREKPKISVTPKSQR